MTLENATLLVSEPPSDDLEDEEEPPRESKLTISKILIYFLKPKKCYKIQSFDIFQLAKNVHK